MTVRPPLALWALFVLQLVCALYFSSDALGDMTGWHPLAALGESDLVEAFLAFVLLLSMIATGWQLRQRYRREQSLQEQVHTASGALGDVMEGYFDRWALTETERVVAIYAIKGFSIQDIADMRETKSGTVKAQLSSIYRKADVSGRPHLISLFIEDLMDGLPMAQDTGHTLH